MKGTFKDLKDINKFIDPLKTIGILVGENGMNITIFNDEDGNRIAMIPARNKNAGLVIIHTWKDLFDDFEIDGDEIRLGLMKTQDLTTKLPIFDDGEVDVEFGDDLMLSFNQKRTKLKFKTADPELINEGKRAFKGAKWIGGFDYGEKLDKFTNALKKMSNEEYVFVEGNEEKGEIMLTIKNKEKRGNSFSCIIDGDVTEDFSSVFRKDFWPVIIDKNATNIRINLGSKMINFSVETEHGNTEYFLSKTMLRNN